MGMKIAFPNFGNKNETLVFPGMIGNGNRNTTRIPAHPWLLVLDQAGDQVSGELRRIKSCLTVCQESYLDFKKSDSIKIQQSGKDWNLLTWPNQSFLFY